MLNLRKGFWIYLCVSFVLQSQNVKAQTSGTDAKTLRGIKAIQVLVEGLGSEAIQGGLSEVMIQTDVELRLRKAGIPIIPKNYFPPPGVKLSTVEMLTGLKGEKAREKWEETHGMGSMLTKEQEEFENLFIKSATLYINANILKIQGQILQPHFVYAIKVVVQQDARLERDTSIICFGAVTWSKGWVGITPADVMERTVRDAIVDFVDIFLNEYLSENPKKD